MTLLTLSYTQPIRLHGLMRRTPSKDQLEFVIVLALALVPLGFWLVRGVFALIVGL